MGRLVRKPQLPDFDEQVAGLDSVLQGDFDAMPLLRHDPGDTPLERMAKYIPAEILGFFVIINAILEQAVLSSNGPATMAGVAVGHIAIGAVVGGMILAPLFCWYVRQDGDAWIVNAIVSTAAFPVWAYLLGAVAFADFHDGDLAAILVLSFSAASGMIRPLPRRVRLRGQDEVVANEDTAPAAEAFAA